MDFKANIGIFLLISVYTSKIINSEDIQDVHDNICIYI